MKAQTARCPALLRWGLLLPIGYWSPTVLLFLFTTLGGALYLREKIRQYGSLRAFATYRPGRPLA